MFQYKNTSRTGETNCAMMEGQNIGFKVGVYIVQVRWLLSDLFGWVPMRTRTVSCTEMRNCNQLIRNYSLPSFKLSFKG